MGDEKLVTVGGYASAFETWRGLARLPDWDAAVLTEGLAHLRVRFDDAPRAVRAFCDAFDAFLSTRADLGRVRGGLRLRIAKSCLLDRLIYRGELPRTEACPEHKGQWNGLRAEVCPHGCSLASCGCTTGWLPARATLVTGEAAYAAAVARAEAAHNEPQAEVWRRHLGAIRAALATLRQE